MGEYEMITDFKLFESKQAGILYHFTSIYSLYQMLSKKEPHIYSSFTNYVSCTRNFDMMSDSLKLEKQCCRITLDGNKMSENLKIKPYLDPNYPEREEREERVSTINTVIDLKKYCLRIDILKEPKINPIRKPINSYSFDINQRLYDKNKIVQKYDLFKEKVKLLKLDFPIFFVDKMKSYSRLMNN